MKNRRAHSVAEVFAFPCLFSRVYLSVSISPRVYFLRVYFWPFPGLFLFSRVYFYVSCLFSVPIFRVYFFAPCLFSRGGLSWPARAPGPYLPSVIGWARWAALLLPGRLTPIPTWRFYVEILRANACAAEAQFRSSRLTPSPPKPIEIS